MCPIPIIEAKKCGMAQPEIDDHWAAWAHQCSLGPWVSQDGHTSTAARGLAHWAGEIANSDSGSSPNTRQGQKKARPEPKSEKVLKAESGSISGSKHHGHGRRLPNDINIEIYGKSERTTGKIPRVINYTYMHIWSWRRKKYHHFNQTEHEPVQSA